jgi:hypothetical protein
MAADPRDSLCGLVLRVVVRPQFLDGPKWLTACTTSPSSLTASGLQLPPCGKGLSRSRKWESDALIFASLK